MPVENFIIPFDNRIFVDYKSLPYIVLNIEEIEGIMEVLTPIPIMLLINYYGIKTIVVRW